MFVKTYDDIGKQLAARKCSYALALGATIENLAHGHYCGKMVITGDPFYSTGLSMVLPKGSQWTEIMSDATLKLTETGSIPTIKDLIARTGLCKNDTDTVLTFDKLRIFFIMAYVVCALLFLEMVIDPQSAFSKTSTLDGKQAYPTETSTEFSEIDGTFDLDKGDAFISTDTTSTGTSV